MGFLIAILVIAVIVVVVGFISTYWPVIVASIAVIIITPIIYNKLKMMNKLKEQRKRIQLEKEKLDKQKEFLHKSANYTAPHNTREEQLKVVKNVVVEWHPRNLDEYIGQKQIKENLKFFIEAAKKRNESLGHLLLHGSPGLGKTMLAKTIASDMGVNIRVISGSNIKKENEIVSILAAINDGDILFINELHSLSPKLKNALSHMMVNYSWDFTFGSGIPARTTHVKLPRFTIIGATARIEQIKPPLRDGFGMVMRMEMYTPVELGLIVSLYAKTLNTSIDNAGAIEIAYCSQGMPQIAKRTLKQVRDLAEVYADGVITRDVVVEAIKRLRGDTSVGLETSGRITIEKIDRCTGVEFEEILNELFSRLGYHVETTKSSGDQGVDLLLKQDGEITAVQAKCYSSSVGNSAVQEIIAGKTYYNAHKAIVVTNNYFTSSAKDLAVSANVLLWDRDKLNEMIYQVY